MAYLFIGALMGALKMSNSKKYRGLNFLDGVQAKRYLEGLTETDITWNEFLDVIRAQERDLYADIKAISHELTDWHFIDGPHDSNDAGRMYADNVDGEAVRVKGYAKHLPHRDYPDVYLKKEVIKIGSIDGEDVEDMELFHQQHFQRAGSKVEGSGGNYYIERPRITFLPEGMLGDLFQATDDNTGQVIQCNVLRPTKEGSGQYIDLGEYEAYFLRQDIESMAAIINNTPGEAPAVPAENDRKEYPPATATPYDETELKRLQRTVAALALGLAAKPGAYSKAGKPNVLQLAKLATEHLRDGQYDRTPHGFSETTVRNTIVAALNACPELKG